MSLQLARRPSKADEARIARILEDTPKEQEIMGRLRAKQAKARLQVGSTALHAALALRRDSWVDTIDGVRGPAGVKNYKERMKGAAMSTGFLRESLGLPTIDDPAVKQRVSKNTRASREKQLAAMPTTSPPRYRGTDATELARAQNADRINRWHQDNNNEHYSLRRAMNVDDRMAPDMFMSQSHLMANRKSLMDSLLSDHAQKQAAAQRGAHGNSNLISSSADEEYEETLAERIERFDEWVDYRLGIDE